jgi:catechol 2,3-dioxygenase-like lactoylglutathione lyase family enzyme
MRIQLSHTALFLAVSIEAFGSSYRSERRGKTLEAVNNNDDNWSRRSFLTLSIAANSLLLSGPVQANVGSLPEFANSNAVLHGITIKVADQSQQKAMISFLEDGFDCEVVRKRIVGTMEETWLSFGPEQLSIPSDCRLPVSSFAKYGGHASIHLVYDATATAPLYRNGDAAAPGDNIAYLQMGVPAYRISQMVKNGGNILDAYGFVNVVSPSGLPIRGIVGISPDPIMFVAINCADVKKSKAFYEQLGFAEQDYPYCRPNQGQGQFEPLQPAKSVYMAPSPNCMGVLLLQSKKKALSPNPVVQSLNLVYNPSVSSDDGDSATRVVDPSGVAIQLQSVGDFEKEESITR